MRPRIINRLSVLTAAWLLAALVLPPPEVGAQDVPITAFSDGAIGAPGNAFDDQVAQLVGPIAADAVLAPPGNTLELGAEVPSESSERGIPWELGLLAIGMTALAKDRDTMKRGTNVLPYPVAAGAKIYAGALIVLDAGFAKPGEIGVDLIAIGRANESVDNTDGADGDVSVLVERGCFRWASADITQAHVGSPAYILDDQTVSFDDDTAARSSAGTIRGVETGGVWVEV